MIKEKTVCIPTVSKDNHPPRNAEELMKEKKRRELKKEFEDNWENPPDILYDSVR